MSEKLRDVFGLDAEDDVYASARFLVGSVLNEDLYFDIIKRAMGLSSTFERDLESYRLGLFSGVAFWAMLSNLTPRSSPDGMPLGVDSGTASYVLDKLILFGLVSDDKIFGNLNMPYRWNKAIIPLFVASGAIENILRGRSRLYKTYKKCVVGIEVEKDGIPFMGTGFIVPYRGVQNEALIVTARHNVDPREGVEFKKLFSGVSGLEIEKSGWIMSDATDIACAIIQCNGVDKYINMFPQANILSSVITLGFPRISMADDAYLAAHSGEVNAIFKNTCGQNMIAISNIVSPGNSGSPVLNEMGFCIGVVVRSLEVKYDGFSAFTNAAVPASDVLDFIQSAFPH